MKFDTSMKYGLATGIGLMVYFMTMVAVDLENVVELRLFNFFIMMAGVYALHRHMYQTQAVKASYLSGLFAGFRLSVIAVTSFVLFLGFYSILINPEFTEFLGSGNLWGASLTPYQAAVAIGFEGVASSLILSFLSMQYFKAFAVDSTEVGLRSHELPHK